MKKLVFIYCIMAFSFFTANADPVIQTFTATPSSSGNIRVVGDSISVNFYIMAARSYPPGVNSFEPGTITLRLVYKTSSGLIEPITAYNTYNAADYKNGPYLDINIDSVNIPKSSIGKTLTIQYSYWSTTSVPAKTIGPVLLNGYLGITGSASNSPDTTTIASLPMAMVSKIDNLINIFAKGSDGSVIRKVYSSSGNGWYPWEKLGTNFTSFYPVGITKDNTSMDIFMVGDDAHLYHKWWTTSGGYSAWEDFGGNFSFPPTAFSKDEGNTIDLFVIGSDNHLYHKWWDKTQWNNSSGGWSAWQDFGGNFTSAPVTISNDGGNTIDLFVLGLDNHLYHKWWNKTQANNSAGGWSAWQDFGGNFSSPPGIIGDNGYTNLFIVGTDNHLHFKWGNNGSAGWSAWQDFGGNFTSRAAALCKDGYVYDIFAVGSDNHLYHKWWKSNLGWSAWEDFGGTLSASPTSAPTIVSNNPQTLDVFAMSLNGSLMRKHFSTTSGWQNWELVSGTN